MGLSSSTTKTSTTPVYGKQIEGAAQTVTDAYNANKGNIASIQGLLNNATNTAYSSYSDNPMLTAAKGYVTSTLNSDPASNPYLDSQIKYTNADVGNSTNALLGTRGLGGGSAAAKIIAGQLAKNESGLRYQDYLTGVNQKNTAAGLASSLNSSDNSNLSSLLSAANSAGNFSTNAANTYGTTIGGLLGSYTNGTSQTSPSILQLMMSAANSAAAAAAKGG